MIARWCIAFVIIFIVLVSVCWYFDKYRKYKYGCLEKISFQKFLEIYNNAPGKITLSEGYICYYRDGVSMFSNGDAFYFSIPDTIRYEHWRKEKVRKEAERITRKIMDALDKAWEKDSEQYKKEQMKNGNTN
jgi:hypothetical protein